MSGREARCWAGSSSINGLLYIRGQHADYDGWRQLGCEGWGWDDVRPYFLRAEHQERGAGEHHAVGGPLNVSDVTQGHEVSGRRRGGLRRGRHSAQRRRQRRRSGRRLLLPAHGQERPAVLGRGRLSAPGDEPGQPARGDPRPDHPRPLRGQEGGGSRIPPGRRTQGRQGGQGSHPRRRRDQFAPASAALRDRARRAAARPWHRARHTPAGSRRESAGPLRDHHDLSAQGRHGVGERTDQGRAVPGRDGEIHLPAQGPAQPFGRPHRRLLQIQARPFQPGHPVPHPAGHHGHRKSSSASRRWSSKTFPA